MTAGSGVPDPAVARPGLRHTKALRRVTLAVEAVGVLLPRDREDNEGFDCVKSAGDPLSVVVADDVLLVRQGVVRVIEAIGGVSVAAEVGDATALRDAVHLHQPDVVITDIAMPPTHTDEGIRAALELREQLPSLGIVVLSQYAEPSFVLDLFADGSDRLGYLLKERVGDPAELGRAIAAVAAGDSVVDPKIVEILVGARRRPSGGVDRLTTRETEVLALMAEGYNNAGIGSELHLSERAIAKHINSMFSKLDLGESEETHRRVKAVLTWLAH